MGVFVCRGGFEIVWRPGSNIRDGFTLAVAKCDDGRGDEREYGLSGVGRARDPDWDRLCHLDRYWRRTVNGYCRLLFLFSEPRDFARLFFIFLIIAGIVES